MAGAPRTGWGYRLAKGGVFVLCLVPLSLLVLDGMADDLGANPVETVTHTTGDWTLRLLLITLAVTPVRRLTGLSVLARFRRMLGLFAFFYACLHFTTWIWLDHGFLWSEVTADIVKRPYVTFGFTAFVLLWPLALTSTRGMMRRLGRNWQRLHRAVYAIAVLGVLHFLWLVKADYLEPAIYGLILVGLLLARLKPNWLTRRQRSPDKPHLSNSPLQAARQR